MESKYSALDVKIQLNCGEQIIKRVPAPVTYEALQTIAKTLLTKNLGYEPTFRIRYQDIDNIFVVVEDDSDLEIAYTLALSGNKKITFAVQHSQEDKPAELQEEVIDTKKGGAAKQVYGKNGIPRKALRTMIQGQLEKQAKDVFNDFLKDKKFDQEPGEKEEPQEAAGVEHHGVECDGCGENPIKGIRYKCSVRKNFDYCQTCEERLPNEHPMLKIKAPGGAPDVMLTFVDDNASPNFAPRGGRGGRGGRGRGGHGGPGRFGPGCGGPGMGGPGGPGGIPGLKKIFKSFLGEADVDLEFLNGPKRGKDSHEFMGNILNAFDQFQKSGKLEEIMKKYNDGDYNDFCTQFNNFKPEGCGRMGQWKLVRASLVKKPEETLQAYAGQMLLPELEIKNGTFWPWKQGCSLTFDDSQDLVGFPVEMIKAPIDFEVKGQATFKMNVPIKVLDSAIADDKEHEIKLTFRGPNGNSFGEPIVLKLRVVATPKVSDEEFYRLALKLHQLGLGSFDQCVQALKNHSCDEAEAVKELQRTPQ